MDKVNIKSAVASAALSQNSSMGSKPLARDVASTNKVSADTGSSRVKTTNSTLNKSSISKWVLSLIAK